MRLLGADGDGRLPSLWRGLEGHRRQRYVVKAFNTVGSAHMFRPSFPGGPPDMFICGNHDEAKKTVVRILSEFGWGCVDTGGIESSRYLEGMCLVWGLYGARTNTWNHAFKLLRRDRKS